MSISAFDYKTMLIKRLIITEKEEQDKKKIMKWMNKTLEYLPYNKKLNVGKEFTKVQGIVKTGIVY